MHIKKQTLLLRIGQVACHWLPRLSSSSSFFEVLLCSIDVQANRLMHYVFYSYSLILIWSPPFDCKVQTLYFCVSTFFGLSPLFLPNSGRCTGYLFTSKIACLIILCWYTQWHYLGSIVFVLSTIHSPKNTRATEVFFFRLSVTIVGFEALSFCLATYTSLSLFPRSTSFFFQGDLLPLLGNFLGDGCFPRKPYPSLDLYLLFVETWLRWVWRYEVNYTTRKIFL